MSTAKAFIPTVVLIRVVSCGVDVVSIRGRVKGHCVGRGFPMVLEVWIVVRSRVIWNVEGGIARSAGCNRLSDLAQIVTCLQLRGVVLLLLVLACAHNGTMTPSERHILGNSRMVIFDILEDLDLQMLIQVRLDPEGYTRDPLDDRGVDRDGLLAFVAHWERR